MKNYALSHAIIGNGLIVSRSGRVFATINDTRIKRGAGRHGSPERVGERFVELSQHMGHSGYMHVGTKRLKTSGDSRRVHRMVLEAFVGPCPEGMVAMHLNSVRHDNKIENLRWGTPSENQQQRSREGKCSRSKIFTEGDIAMIRSSGDRQVDLAARFGVTQGYISAIKRGVAGSHPKVVK